jgi:hypothetical protein
MSEPVPTYDIELSPVARQLRIAYLHDIDLRAGEGLTRGDRVILRDEGLALWDAEVLTREVVRLGHKYRLHISPRSG